MKSVYFKNIITILILITYFIFNPIASNASVLSVKKDKDGISLGLDKGLMKVKICTENVVEVRYTIFPTFPTKESLVIINKWISSPAFSVTESANEVVISTAKLKVKVNKSNQSVTYTDLKDNVIVSEDKGNGKKMIEATIAGIKTYNCETLFNSPTDEALYGLGCHPEDTLSINYKGRNQSMAIKYMTGAIPVLLSNKGYGLLWDNYSASEFYGAETSNSQYKYVSESGLMVDYYFIYGPEFDQIIASYRNATGAAPMFGKWAFGLFQSQDLSLIHI